MPSPVPPIRRPLGIDPEDEDAIRRWMKESVEEDIFLHGGPRPRIVVVGNRFADTLDLDLATRRFPSGHPGATFQSILAVPGVVAGFLVVIKTLKTLDGDVTRMAAILEQRGGEDSPSFWEAELRFRADEFRPLRNGR